jgi:hypothetical protein
VGGRARRARFRFDVKRLPAGLDAGMSSDSQLKGPSSFTDKTPQWLEWRFDRAAAGRYYSFSADGWKST